MHILFSVWRVFKREVDHVPCEVPVLCVKFGHLLSLVSAAGLELGIFLEVF